MFRLYNESGEGVQRNIWESKKQTREEPSTIITFLQLSE
jgi:hypothetical protein